jgi:hypothetical protein
MFENPSHNKKSYYYHYNSRRNEVNCENKRELLEEWGVEETASDEAAEESIGEMRR